MQVLIFFLLILTFSFFVPVSQARITPQDTLNSQKESYNQKVATYSKESKQKLEHISNQIANINKVRTDQLALNMEIQGAILDEYQRRNKDQATKAIGNGRYWLTFGEEAVAYQQAKIYIFDLTNEDNIKPDIQRTINQFKLDLNYARDNVIKSQKILEELVK